jgi:hypothetical protein
MPKRTTPRPDASDATTPNPARPATARGRRTGRRTGASTDTAATATTSDAAAATAERAPTSSDTIETVEQPNEAAQQPNEDDVRHHAYHLYLKRGAGHGSDFDDWVRAEQELKRKPKH